MSDRLDHMARRVEGDPHFLAAALASFARSEDLDDAGLAERLGCQVEQLPHLKLCRRPEPAADRYEDDIRQIADRFGVRAEVLSDVCRRFEPAAGAELAGRQMPGDGASITDRPSVRWVGRRGEGGAQVVRVTDDGQELPLPKRFDLRNHSPSGFEWGYGGSGPAQLALALLADAVGDARAEELYQRFKRAVVARLDRDEWELTREEVEAWLRGAATEQD